MSSRIIIEFNNDNDAENYRDDVSQLFMRRNPMDEPSISVELDSNKKAVLTFYDDHTAVNGEGKSLHGTINHRSGIDEHHENGMIKRTASGTNFVFSVYGEKDNIRPHTLCLNSIIEDIRKALFS